MKKCKNCEYFRKELKAGVNNGICILYPPVPIAINYATGVNITMVYPIVNHESICGQFEAMIKPVSEKYPEA